MNEPDITSRIPARAPARRPAGIPGHVAACAAACGAALAASRRPPRLTPEAPCHACSPWARFPVIGPALTVLIAIVSALALVSNANAFNDVNAELQIAARDQRLAKIEAQRVAREQAARQATLVAANERSSNAPARVQPVVQRTGEEKKGRAQ